MLPCERGGPRTSDYLQVCRVLVACWLLEQCLKPVLGPKELSALSDRYRESAGSWAVESSDVVCEAVTT